MIVARSGEHTATLTMPTQPLPQVLAVLPVGSVTTLRLRQQSAAARCGEPTLAGTA